MKHLVMFIFLVSTLNLIAQDENPTQKGNLMVGGGGNLSYLIGIDEGSSGNLNLGLSPSIGWFLSDGFALGIGPSFSISSSFGEYSLTSYGVGTDMFVVKYFSSGIFIKGSTGYSLSHLNASTPEYDVDNYIHNINIVPEVGYAFFLGPNVALELSLTNTFTIMLSDGSTAYFSNSGVSAGFQIFL